MSLQIVKLPPITIPVYQPAIDGKEWGNVKQCLESSWISSKGPFLERFEKEFARKVQAKHAVAVCNGTTALHAALLAIGVGPGDEVIVPTLTYIAPVNAVRYTGAKPVFVDADPQTWQINHNFVSRQIQKKTKAILAVHLYGHPCNLPALRKIAKKFKIHLVEDCAEALGSRWADKPVGKGADVATYSFFGNKTITTGEGGMVTTDDDAIAKALKSIKGQGLAFGREYWHDRIGFNYRMTNICAAIGVAQLKKLDRFLLEKKKLHRFYQRELAPCPVLFQELEPRSKSSFWMISILCSDQSHRDKLRIWLRQKGIETRPLFQPIHLMPMYQAAAGRGRFPVAEELARRGLNLPSHPSLTRDERKKVVFWVKQFFKTA